MDRPLKEYIEAALNIIIALSVLGLVVYLFAGGVLADFFQIYATSLYG